MSATDKFFCKNSCNLKMRVVYCTYLFREAYAFMRNFAAQFYFYYYFYPVKK